MITNFNKYNENKDPMFSVNIDGRTLIFRLKYGKEITIDLDGEKYQTLSITIPDTKKCDDNEFFMDPNIDPKIIKVLIDENFIEKSNLDSIAGDKRVYSYKLV